MKYKKQISLFLVAFLLMFNIYDINILSKKITINKNQRVEALEPISSSILASVVAGICLSLGFNLVQSTGPMFEQGCMTLYNNFSQNVKNIIDRIARLKIDGLENYKISTDELSQIHDEVNSFIETNLEGTYLYNKIWDVKVPDGLSSYQKYNVHLDTIDFYSSDFELNQYYLYYPYVVFSDGSIYDFSDPWGNIYLKFISPTYFKMYYGKNLNDLTYMYPESRNSNAISLDFEYTQNYMSSFVFLDPYRYSINRKYLYTDIENTPYKTLGLRIGDKTVSEPLIYKGHEYNMSELLLLLSMNNGIDKENNVSQTFINNYVSAKPSDVYESLNVKTAIDTLFDGADTNVPDVPQDFTILQSMYQVLRDLYQNVRTGNNTISNTLSQILTNVKAIPHTIANTVSSLFVPPEGFMTPLITDFQDSMSAKFGDRTIDLTQFSSTRIPEDIEITIMGQTVKVFESQLLIDFVEAVRAWIIGFIGILAMIYNFNNVYRIFAGAEYVGSTGSSQLNTQGMLQGNNDSGFLKLGGGK